MGPLAFENSSIIYETKLVQVDFVGDDEQVEKLVQYRSESPSTRMAFYAQNKLWSGMILT
jgi:hypothetical protein